MRDVPAIGGIKDLSCHSAAPRGDRTPALRAAYLPTAGALEVIEFGIVERRLDSVEPLLNDVITGGRFSRAFQYTPAPLENRQPEVGLRVVPRAAVEKEMRAAIKATSPTAKVDYIAFTDFHSLKTVARIKTHCVCSLAVKVHGVRLIDNLGLNIPEKNTR